MGAIFLSYAREDRACAETLAAVLEGAGHQVWWDRRIESGLEFAAEIEAALDTADVVLVLWSRNSIKSRWVRDEAAIGGDSGRLVPALIDVAQPPIGFRQFQAFDLAGWKGARKDKRTVELLGEIERRLERRAGSEPAPPAAPAGSTPRRGRQLGGRGWAIAAAILLVIAAGAALIVQNALRTPTGPLKPTIGLVPFTIASTDPEMRELASQARDSLAHTFSQSGLPLRLLNAAPQDGQPSVDFLITGDFSRNGDKVLASLRLEEPAQRVTVFSDRFEATHDDVRQLPERIGAQFAGNLAWGAPMMVLDRRNPIAPQLLAELLVGADFSSGLENLQGYQSAKRVAAKAPDLPIAQINAAFGTAFVLGQLPLNERPKALAEARHAADRAMALAPQFGDVHAIWCTLHSETRHAECEDRLRAGRRIDPDAPFLNTFLSHRMRSVGRLDESGDLARLAYTHDIYVPTKLGWMLKTLEYTGESEAARELYGQGTRWWPEYKPMFVRNRMYGLLERGDFEGISALEREIGSKELTPDYQTTNILVAALKARSIPAARRACPDSDDFLLNIRCMLTLSIVGDQDGAYAIAAKLYPRRVGRTPAETERIWLTEIEGTAPLAFITSPAAAPMRRDPRFLQLAQRVGLLDYWRTGRLPDFCREKPEPICAQLLKRR